MRESLTILAILLIVVLTTALVGPYLVDWNAHRGEIEARLSSLLGGKVALAGPIDVRLLPRPIFRLQKLTVSGTTPRDPRMTAERVDLELALTALLHGEFRFVEADLTKPRLVLTADRDGSVVLPSFGADDPASVSLASLVLRDGAVAVVGEAGNRILDATGLNGEGEAESLAGPFKFAGRLDTARGPQGFHFATGAYQAGRVRLKATLDPVSGSPKADLEGMLSLTMGRAKAAALLFDGALTATGQAPLAGTPATIPWRLTSRLRAGPGDVALNSLELRAGADERAFIAEGDGALDLGAAPGLRLALRARQVDLAKLAVLPEGGSSNDEAAPSVPTLADQIGALNAFAGNPDAFAALPVPVTLDYAANTLLFGTQTLTGLAGRVVLSAGKPAVGSFAVEAADASKIKLDGSFEPGPAAVFKGRLEAASRNVGRLADGLASDLPDVAAWIRRTLPVKAFAFTGTVDLSGVGFAAHDAVIGLDQSAFSGTVTLTRAVGTDRARFFADLTSDALDLDALPNLQGTTDALSDLDLSVALSARAVRLAQTDAGPVDAGRIALRLNKTGSTLSLDRFVLSDIGGATADVTGRSDGRNAHLEGRFDARRLGDLSALLDRLAPSAFGAALKARADLLSPALFRLSADATVGEDGGFLPVRASLDGTAAGTKVALRLQPGVAPDPADPLSPFRSGRTFAASATLDAPESGALLRQLGLAASAPTAIGRAHVAATTRVTDTGHLDGTVEATLADTVLSFKGRGTAGGEGAGRLTLRGANAAPLLRTLAVATPEPNAIWPFELASDLNWTGGKLTAGNLAGRTAGTSFDGMLTLSTPAGASPTIPDIGSDGSATGKAVLPAAIPTVSGTLRLDRLSAAQLAGLALGPVPLPASASASKAGSLWPDRPFGPLLFRLPTAEVGLMVAALPLSETQTARDAKLTLRLAPGVVTLADLTAALGEGRVDATLTLRRDAGAASLAGHLGWNGLALATPSLAGRSAGALDLVGTGSTEAGLVASLGGTGTIAIEDARLPRLDPGALARVVDAAATASSSIEEGQIREDIDRELNRGALSLGPVKASLTVAAGVLRAEPIVVDGPVLTTGLAASLDLRSLDWSLRVTGSTRNPPADWTGRPAQVGVTWQGPFTDPVREVDAAALVNGIAARAIAKDQARIEAFQDDVRERAFFARRLKAIEAEQAQQGRDKAEDASRQKGSAPRLPGDASPSKGLAPSSGGATTDDPKTGPGAPDPLSKGDEISRFLNGQKGSTPPAPVPVRRPAATKPNDKPVNLQPGFPRTQATPSVPSDPGSAGRY